MLKLTDSKQPAYRWLSNQTVVDGLHVQSPGMRARINPGVLVSPADTGNIGGAEF